MVSSEYLIAVPIPPPPPPAILISTVLVEELYAIVLPLPIKLRVVIPVGPESSLIKVPAEEIPTTNPLVAVNSPLRV